MRLKSKYKKKREKRTFWVINSGRCGSKSICHILNEAQNADVYHEPIWTQSRLNLWVPVYLEYRKREKGSFGKDWLKDMKLRLAHHRGEMIWQAHDHGKIYGETSPIMEVLLPAIKEVYGDNGQFIHLVRHPFHQVRSQVHYGWYSPHQDRATGMVTIKPDDFGESQKAWDSLDVTMKNLWYWTFQQKQIIEMFKDIPEEQKTILRLEDLNLPNVKMIYEWLGLTPFQSDRIGEDLDEAQEELKEEWAKRMEQELLIKRHKFPETTWMVHWVEWDTQHREMFEEMAEGLMEHFNYEWDY